MNTETSSIIPWWLRQPHLLLAGHLLLLHALAFGGRKLPAVRILWFVASAYSCSGSPSSPASGA